MDEHPNIEMTAIDPSRAIDLRWTLRDVQGKRRGLYSRNADFLHQLAEMGLIDLQGDRPVLTEAGYRAVD